MIDLLGTVGTAIGAFTATNIDDFVLLTILFIDSPAGSLRRGYIVAGQYLGFTILLAVSGAAAAGLVAGSVPARWLGLLGLIPLTASVRGFLRAARRRDDDEAHPVVSNTVLSVTAVTVANGGDNIAVYVLIFHAQATADTAVTVVTFLVLLAIWCAAAALTSTYAQSLSLLISVRKWLVPIVYLVIGIVILIRSGVLIRLAQVAALNS